MFGHHPTGETMWHKEFMERERIRKRRRNVLLVVSAAVACALWVLA